MAIIASELETRYSGGTSGTATTSLGGGMSNTSFTDNVANNLFDDVSGAESAAGDIEYRAFYIRNGNGSLTWSNVYYWISSLTSSTYTEFDIALASEAVNTAIAQTIANEGTAPSGVSFTRPTSKATGLSIGNIPNGQFKGLWVKRTVTAGATAASDTGTISLEGDTPA